MALESDDLVDKPTIRVGVGGWTYAPWRNHFYPKNWPYARELQFASQHLTSIEVNGTYFSMLKPASFKKWYQETPDSFMFSLKATCHATNRRVLAEAGDSINRFLESGITELGQKLGPIVWQFMPGKMFDAEDFEAFLRLLPRQIDRLVLRHVMDVRNESFMTASYLALARRYKVATVFSDSDKISSFADLTADFVYARLMMSNASIETGYDDAALDAWAQRALLWSSGHAPNDLPALEKLELPQNQSRPRDVFIYFINGAKERAPAAGMSLLKRLGLPAFKAAA